MDLGHAFVEIHAVVLNRRHAHIGPGSERVAFALYLLHGGDLTKAGNILVFTLSELFCQPVKLVYFGDNALNFLYKSLSLSVKGFLIARFCLLECQLS